MLYQLMELIQYRDAKAHIVYIKKEDLAFAAIKNAEDLNRYVQLHKADQQKTYLFIDEIQDIENF